MYLEKMRRHEMFYLPAQGDAATIPQATSTLFATGPVCHGHGRIRTSRPMEKHGLSLLFPVCAI